MSKAFAFCSFVKSLSVLMRRELEVQCTVYAQVLRDVHCYVLVHVCTPTMSPLCRRVSAKWMDVQVYSSEQSAHPACHAHTARGSKGLSSNLLIN